MDLDLFVVPLGVLAYTLLVATILSGLFRVKFKLKLRHHKLPALLTVILATVHAGTIIYLTRKGRQ
ncbi:MAG: hypothetical protein ABII89_02710 [Candidatus Omnitrophota bacterium]